MQALLLLASAYQTIGYAPPESWREAFISLTGAVLQTLAELALQDTRAAEEEEQRVASNPLAGARRGGLISMPEQQSTKSTAVQVDQVVTADGEAVEIEQEAASSAPSGPAGPRPFTRLRLGPLAWLGIAQAVVSWQLRVDEAWVQHYIEASYGAMRASATILEAAATGEELEGEEEEEEQGPLVTRAFIAGALADVALLPLMLQANPGKEWGSAMAAAARAALALVPSAASDPNGFEARYVTGKSGES